MPELPEVETILCGLRPHLLGARILKLKVRERRLRWQIPRNLPAKVRGQKVSAMHRRGKYIWLQLGNGGLLIHLGMSGSFRVLDADTPPEVHEHYDLCTERGRIIRYRDPRRFGCLLWTTGALESHARIKILGVEPLDDAFDGDYLYAKSRSRSCAVKTYLMDARVVVGVGNIYAAEALFAAGVHPLRACNRVSKTRYCGLADAVRATLREAIRQGGSTIRDFSGTDGVPGYFAQTLSVYGREGEGCSVCGAVIRRVVVGGRSTFYCGRCQR